MNPGIVILAILLFGALILGTASWALRRQAGLRATDEDPIVKIHRDAAAHVSPQWEELTVAMTSAQFLRIVSGFLSIVATFLTAAAIGMLAMIAIGSG